MMLSLSAKHMTAAGISSDGGYLLVCEEQDNLSFVQPAACYFPPVSGSEMPPANANVCVVYIFITTSIDGMPSVK